MTIKSKQRGFTPPHLSQKGLVEKFKWSNKKHIVRNRLFRKSGAGFTLIELLVVISIIGLLASVVLVSLNSARQKARNAKRLSQANQLAKAFELFYNDAGGYPTGTGAMGSGYAAAGTGAVLGSIQLQHINSRGTFTMTPTYMVAIPTAPTPQDGSCTSSNNAYVYEVDDAGTRFTLSFCLGAATGSLSAGVRYLTPAGFR